jgi:hypothetical protein
MHDAADIRLVQAHGAPRSRTARSRVLSGHDDSPPSHRHRSLRLIHMFTAGGIGRAWYENGPGIRSLFPFRPLSWIFGRCVAPIQQPPEEVVQVMVRLAEPIEFVTAPLAINQDDSISIVFL